jgi:hypothetical protein
VSTTPAGIASSDPAERRLLEVARDVPRQLLGRYAALGPSASN